MRGGFGAITIAVGLMWPALLVSAADWPALHGPDGAGTSPEQGLARTWPVEGPPVLWKLAVGEGWSGPVIHGGELFLLDRVPVEPARATPVTLPAREPDRIVLTRDEPNRDILMCLDLATGKEQWRLSWDSPAQSKLQIGNSRSVPAVDAERVYALRPTGELHVVDRKTGKESWSAHLVRDFPGRADDIKTVIDERYAAVYSEGRSQWRRFGRVPQWGFTQCPVLHRDVVILAPMTEKVGLVAYEKATGRIRWTSPFVGREFFSHSSPVLMNLCGVDQIIYIANKTHLPSDPALITSVVADSGKLLWRNVTWRKYNVPIPMPLKIAADRIFITGGYRVGCGILKVSRRGEQWTTEYVMKDNGDCTAHIQTPVWMGGHIYAQSFDEYHNTTVPNNGLICMDDGGKLLWKSGPDELFDNGSIIGAAGMLYVLNARSGELHLIEPSLNKFTTLAKAKVLSARGGRAWAPMALSDGRLIVRDLSEMKCLDVRGVAAR